MSRACIVGAFEHPTRKAEGISVAQLHMQSARGALADAGLTFDDVDGYFCAGDAPGLGPMSMLEYMNLNVSHFDSTDSGGSAYLVHVAHAAQAIATGKCNVALITLAGRPRAAGMKSAKMPLAPTPDTPFEAPHAASIVEMYGMVAARHMHEFGTTSEQLA